MPDLCKLHQYLNATGDGAIAGYQQVITTTPGAPALQALLVLGGGFVVVSDRGVPNLWDLQLIMVRSTASM